MDTSIIYQDRNNDFSLVLRKNGTALSSGDMTSIDKYEIRYKGAYYDSDDYPTAFEVDTATATVTIHPQPFGLAASTKKGDIVEFIVYDDVTYPEGLVWDQFKLIVKKDAALIT